MIYAPFNHTKQMLLLVLIGQRLFCIPLIGKFLGKLVEYVIRVVFGSDISCCAKIPRDVMFIHGHDIVIGAAVKIGARCKIFNGVTLGNKDTEDDATAQPIVGDDCVISTGAKILGRISIGNNSIVGANAVVLVDVPANSIAVGVPARVIPRDKSARKESL